MSVAAAAGGCGTLSICMPAAKPVSTTSRKCGTAAGPDPTCGPGLARARAQGAAPRIRHALRPPLVPRHARVRAQHHGRDQPLGRFHRRHAADELAASATAGQCSHARTDHGRSLRAGRGSPACRRPRIAAVAAGRLTAEAAARAAGAVALRASVAKAEPRRRGAHPRRGARLAPVGVVRRGTCVRAGGALAGTFARAARRRRRAGDLRRCAEAHARASRLAQVAAAQLPPFAVPPVRARSAGRGLAGVRPRTVWAGRERQLCQGRS